MSQFQKGQSGNPTGRPPGISDKRTEFRKLLEPHAAALINKCVELALEGNEACLRLTLERILPRAKDTTALFTLPSGKITKESIPEIGEAILRQIESGDTTPEQAHSLLNVIKIYNDIAPRVASQDMSLLERMQNAANAYTKEY